MASGAFRSPSLFLLVQNLILYFIIIVITSWAVNHSIHRSHEQASILPIPARIFPIFFPMGNMATGFFVVLSFLAGIVGITTSFTGIQSVVVSNPENLHAAASSSLASFALTLLAMGLACKEIDIGWTDATLRTLEVVTIIVSATQLLCTGTLQAGAQEAETRRRILG